VLYFWFNCSSHIILAFWEVIGLKFTSAKCFGRKIIIGMRALPAMPWNNSFGRARPQAAITA
jgi:hypothetical protein